MLGLTVYILVFIILSGFLAMIDAAILSVSPAEVEEMVLQKKKGARTLRRLKSDVTRAVVVIVILTNTVNVLGPILVGQYAIEQFGNAIIGVITAVLTFGTIICSEIIPKALGAHYAPMISRMIAPAILFLIYALFPIVWLLDAIADLFTTGKRKIGTEAQIRSLVTIGREEGHIESDEGQLIHRAFILNDKKAGDIMTDLRDIISVRCEQSIRDAANVVFRTPYSRIPIFGTSIHEVKGFAHSQDILESITLGHDKRSICSIKRDPIVVEHDACADELLDLFREKQIHLAIVQEEGKTVGLVTLEDVLEELVGEIEDEMDSEGN